MMMIEMVNGNKRATMIMVNVIMMIAMIAIWKSIDCGNENCNDDSNYVKGGKKGNIDDMNTNNNDYSDVSNGINNDG